MRTVPERPKSQVLYHGEACVVGPRAPHGAIAVPKVHPETPKISKTIQNNLTKKESRRRRRLCTKKDQGRHPWNMQNRAGAYTGARFAHVASHEKTYETWCQLVPTNNAGKQKNRRKNVGKAKSVRLRPQGQTQGTGVNPRRRPPPDKSTGVPLCAPGVLSRYIYIYIYVYINMFDVLSLTL